MAELGLIGLVLQVSEIGVRLGLKLYDIGYTISTAEDTIAFMAKDVSHTSHILKDLSRILEIAFEFNSCSEVAHTTATSLIAECQEVFEEIDKVIVIKPTRFGLNGSNVNLAVVKIERRLRWPFLQPKIKMLSQKLSKLTSRLHLMLNVMIYARQISTR